MHITCQPSRDCRYACRITRIVVVFPPPGRIGLVLENPLPYPRDMKALELRRLVSANHESIMTTTLPDLSR
jgi:NitT/TauT family transport system ATP-binding protein